jgi:hypothetical protein
MKKISLKNITEGLKRDEMRMIQGGYGCGSPVGSYCAIGSPAWTCATGLRCVSKPIYVGDKTNGICVK